MLSNHPLIDEMPKPKWYFGMKNPTTIQPRFPSTQFPWKVALKKTEEALPQQELIIKSAILFFTFSTSKDQDRRVEDESDTEYFSAIKR